MSTADVVVPTDTTRVVAHPNVEEATLADPVDNDHYRKLPGGNFSEKTLSALDIRATPWFVWPVFVISIVSGASSAAITKSMHGAAPISLAGWRHQISTLVFLPGFLWQWSRLTKSERHKALLPGNIGILLLCGITYSAHFAAYFWSLDHTSVTHSLFLTCMSPIFVAIYTKVLGRALLSGEVAGVSLGLVGAAILGAGTRVEKDLSSTHIGDLAAVGAAASFAAYLTLGRRLRSWMSLFVFQFPVILFATISLGVTGVLIEGWNESNSGEISGLFGWIRKEYLLGTILLAVIPGFLGHAGYSTILRYSSPLLLPTGISFQPLLGSTLGWAVGENSIPGLWTCVGGMVTLCGTLCVSYTSERYKAKFKKVCGDHSDEYQQPAADEEGQQGTKPLLQASDLP